MKFICTLPEQKHYKSMQSTTPDKYIWIDKASRLLRVITPVPDPWRQKWVVLPTINTAKNDTYQYPDKLSLRCFAVDEINKDTPFGSIKREIMRGKFACSQNSPALFYCFALEANEQTQSRSLRLQWLLYSFYQL